jgi:glycosyltransferase involved in cell wall biosynthesis
MNEPIRILMVNYKMQCAGIEAFIMNMYRNVDRSKVQFDFLVHYTERQFYDDEIEQLGGKIYRLSIREDNNFKKYLSDLKYFFAQHPEYKIIHGHMESFGGFYFKEAKSAGIPVRIAHSHIAQSNKGLKGFVKKVMNRSFKTYATDLFACSQVAGTFLFGSNAEFTVFNNAVDIGKFRFNQSVREEVRKELNLTDEFIIGHVGRFNTQKNHTFLIDIFKAIHVRNSEAVLLLIGEGDLENEIKRKVQELGLESNVKFLGVRRDVNRLFQAMDVFILPSLFEGLPVAGVEAQAAGLKCIFTDTVTKQTSVTDNTEYYPIGMDTDKWADEILKWESAYIRIDMSTDIKKAGYDIMEQARQLQEFYLSHQKYTRRILAE